MEPDTQLAGLKLQLRETTYKLAQREQELAYFRDQIEAVQTDHQQLCDMVAALKASAVAQENAALREENEKLVGEFEMLEKRVSEMESIHILDQQEKSLMTQELSRLHQDNERKSHDRQRTIEIYEERISKLRRMLQSTESELHQLRLENSALQTEIEDHSLCKDTISALKATISSMNLGNIEEQKVEDSDYQVDLVQLWKQTLIHAILITSPNSKKTELQTLCEEIDAKSTDLEFISQIPTRLSAILKDTKMQISKKHRKSPINSQEESIFLRVIGDMDGESAGIFQLHGKNTLKYRENGEIEEKNVSLDAIYVRNGEEIEREIREIVGKAGKMPGLVLIQGGNEHKLQELFTLTVKIVLFSLENVYCRLKEISETESISILPQSKALQFSAEFEDFWLLESKEQLLELVASVWTQWSGSHVLLTVRQGETVMGVVGMQGETGTQEVLCKVVSALYARRHHVPYRNALLTEEMREVLEPDMRVLAILALHPSSPDLSRQALHFGLQLISQREAAESRQRALALNLSSKKPSILIGKETANYSFSISSSFFSSLFTSFPMRNLAIFRSSRAE